MLRTSSARKQSFWTAAFRASCYYKYTWTVCIQGHTSCAGGCHNMPPPPASLPLTFCPWKWCRNHVTWATSVPILVFSGLSVLELGPMYATDRQTSDVHRRLMPPTLGAGHNYCTKPQLWNLKSGVLWCPLFKRWITQGYSNSLG